MKIYFLSLLAVAVFAAASAASAGETARERKAYRFDFGSAATEPGYTAVAPGDAYDARRGFGWVGAPQLTARDREQPDALRRDYVFGGPPAVFRVNVAPGLYRLTIITGDMEYGDHVLKVSVADRETPAIEQRAAEFSTLTAVVEAKTDTLDITLASPTNNWVLNALSLEPVAAPETTAIARQAFRREYRSTWADVASWPDPTKPLLARFREQSARAAITPTGRSRADYLKLIAGNVDFFKRHQNADGAIIDPHRKVEWQYSTPAFAHAAALLVARAGRRDLVEPAAKALDWSARTLSERRAASGHEDFFPPMLAHAIPLLKPHVPPERSARWEADIRRFDPIKIYRVTPGGSNWNVVSLSGEALFQKMGLRDRESTYVSDSLAAQGRHFGSPSGLYLEGPMAYDHFPRLWLADMIAQGYDGPYRAEVDEVLRRGAITSLFMQSPWGELPAGGRSAHHQWNEAEQCVTYEIYAAQALKNNDPALAGVFKRAAHLALSSMRRWVRPSGEMQIVKNRVDPAERHAYEGYSAHSQYNLLAMAMLAIAYEHAGATETIPEKPAPADVGGFVLEIAPLHKVFANAGGVYVEIDTNADHHYDATGLIRVHARGVSPQLGPSDSLPAHPSYQAPRTSPTTTGIGVSWKDASGAWRTLGELDDTNIKGWAVKSVSASPGRVVFDIVYEGDLFGASRIVERYVVTPRGVELTTELNGYDGPLRYVWPVLADDGRTQSAITVNGGMVSVSQDGGKTAQTFTPRGAGSVRVEAERYANHNGWARLAIAEYPGGGKITLVIAPARR